MNLPFWSLFVPEIPPIKLDKNDCFIAVNGFIKATIKVIPVNAFCIAVIHSGQSTVPKKSVKLLSRACKPKRIAISSEKSELNHAGDGSKKLLSFIFFWKIV
jgi:hypothetical protein